MDFLKAHPNVTREEYMWEWSVPQIMLASADFTHLVYPKRKKERKGKKGRKKTCSSARPPKSYSSPADLAADLGLPVFNSNKK